MREIDLADLSCDEEEDELTVLDRKEATAKEHQPEFQRRMQEKLRPEQPAQLEELEKPYRSAGNITRRVRVRV